MTNHILPSVITENIAIKHQREILGSEYPDVPESLRRMSALLDKRERKIKRLEKKVADCKRG